MTTGIILRRLLTTATVVAGFGLVGVSPGQALAATTYFVSPSGSDAGSCAANSSSAPFQTIQKAVACTVNGDAISLAPSGSTPYPGIGPVPDNITIHAGAGNTARSVTVDASLPNAFVNFPANGSLTVKSGASVELDDVTLTCVANACQYPTVINQGTLTLRRDAVTSNTQEPGILNQPPSPTGAAAHLTVLNSTIAGNTSTGLGIGDSGPADDAGGIVDYFNSQATIANSTITGNTDTRGPGTAGGLYVSAPLSGTAVTLINDTISDNHVTNTGTSTSSAPGGVLDSAPAGSTALAAANTIIAANTTTSSAGAPDCSGPIADTEGGHNLVGDPTNCTGLTADDQTGTATHPLNPGLDGLANNGGPTDTMAVQTASPALGMGSQAACTADPIDDLDQRGDPRHSTARGCDAGAYDTGGNPTPGHTYFVSPSGSDAGTCAANSSSAPFQTIQKAIGCTVNGDAISLAPSGSTPYPGIGTISDNISIHAAAGANARSVTVDVSEPNFIPAGVTGTVIVSTGASVEIDDVTLTCQQNDCESPTAYNQGDLVLRRDELTHNTHDGAILNDPASGSSAHLTVVASTITGNTADGLSIGPGSSPGADAGGVVNLNHGYATIANTTITGNTNSRGPGDAGAIFNSAPASGTSLTLINDTITENHLTGTGISTTPSPGGVNAGASSGTPVLAANTIIAGNTTTSSTGGPDCNGSITDTDGGHNLIGDPTNCTGLTANDQTGTAAHPLSPGLNGLADNGGSTDTMAPDLSSPVVNAGSASACLDYPVPNVDQRGVTRSADSRNTCDVGAYDTGGVVASPAAGTRANGIAFAPDGSRAYVTNLGANTVTVLDTSGATPHSVATVPVGALPDGVASSPSGTSVYVANLYSNSVSVIDTTTNTVVKTIAVGANPTGIAVATTPADQSFAYVANGSGHSVSVINVATNAVVATIAVGGGPSGVAASPDGTRIYVANTTLNQVSVISTATNTVIGTIVAGGKPAYDAVSPDGNTLFVAEPTANQIAVYNVSTSPAAFVRAVPVPGAPYGVAVSPDGSVVYASASGANAVSVFGASGTAPFSVVPVGQVPDGLAFTPDGHYVYVANENSSNVSVLPVDEAVPGGSALFHTAERHVAQIVGIGRSTISAGAARARALRALRQRAARHHSQIRHFHAGLAPVR